MAGIVYLLCTITSVGCAGMLFRAYQRKPSRLLIWTTACFVALGMNNILLFLDLAIIPNIDFSFYRALTALLGAGTLAFGLIWDST